MSADPFDPFAELRELAELLQQDAPALADVPFALTPEPSTRKGFEPALPWDREDYWNEEADRDRRAGKE